MSVARTGVFVDSYLEFSNSLPGDLRRLLSTMRELDERSHAMLHQTREQTKYCLSLLSQCSSKATAEHKEMVEKLKKEVTAGQDQTISLCTEKVLLAQQAYELIDSHMKRLDEDLSQFADDLKQEGKIAHDEPAILPLTSIREERRRSYHFTSQLRRLDLRVERDCERDRDRDFELMPPPDGHRRAVPSYAEVEKLTEPNSPTYCICNQVSFGDMIACDNPNCEGGEWFHYVCVGLTPETRFKGKWFCPTCKDLRQRDIEQQLKQKDIEPTG